MMIFAKAEISIAENILKKFSEDFNNFAGLRINNEKSILGLSSGVTFDEKRNMRPISWKTIYQPLDKGGLGISQSQRLQQQLFLTI